MTEVGITEVQCPCCKLFYEEKDPPSFPGRSTPIAIGRDICWDCVPHQGVVTDQGKWQRGKKHGEMLRREYLRTRERIDAAHDELTEMHRELEMRPTRVVVRVENLDEYVVEQNRKDRDQAYHRRDVAMGALSDVRMHHHRNPQDRVRCICTVRYEQCIVAQLVDAWDGVLLWERSQAGAARRHEQHHLHRDHPALKDERYFDSVYGNEA